MIAHRLEIAQVQRKISALDLLVNNKNVRILAGFLARSHFFTAYQPDWPAASKLNQTPMFVYTKFGSINQALDRYVDTGSFVFAISKKFLEPLMFSTFKFPLLIVLSPKCLYFDN